MVPFDVEPLLSSCNLYPLLRSHLRTGSALTFPLKPAVLEELTQLESDLYAWSGEERLWAWLEGVHAEHSESAWWAAAEQAGRFRAEMFISRAPESATRRSGVREVNLQLPRFCGRLQVAEPADTALRLKLRDVSPKMLRIVLWNQEVCRQALSAAF